MEIGIDLLETPLIHCHESDVDSFNKLNLEVDINVATRYFSVIHQNIRSYSKNIDGFLVLLESLKRKFSCIVLTEAWLNNDSDLMQIKGYNMFRSYNSRNQSDGIVIYIDSSLSVSCEQVSLGDVATALSLTFDWAGERCRLLAVYRSPNSSLPRFIESMNEYCNESMRGRGIQIITGDMNCDTMCAPPNSIQERYLDVMCDAGFVAAVDKVTRPASGTCLDHYFLKLPNKFNASSVVLQTSLTDHCATCLIIRSDQAEIIDNVNNYIFKTDWKRVHGYLLNQSWTKVIGATDVNVATIEFTEALRNIVSLSSDQIKCRAKNTKLKPWITIGLINSVRHRDAMSKKLIKQPFNSVLRNKFVQYRNILHSTIKQAKFRYYKSRVNQVSDAKQFWAVVNEVAGKKGNKEMFPVEEFLGNGDAVTPPTLKELTNSFNTYFASVGSRLAGAIHPAGSVEVSDADCAVESVFELRPLNQLELLDIIKSMKGRSAPGLDAIPPQLFKKNFLCLSQPLLHIVNLSIRTGKFPDALKIANVIPIFKGGSKNAFSNYRPISLLNILAKIIEKCIKCQLTEYLNRFNLISNIQYGFRANKNTSHALFDLTKFITNEISLKKQVIVSFLDLAKAFDSVDRTNLLLKLEAIGVKNVSLDWFKGYLQNRVQCVSINKQSSDVANVDYGVVQGSTLGPLLFLIYINNISRLKIRGQLFLFADDTVLVSAGSTWEETLIQAEDDLAKIKNWFDHNLLTVNIEKTKFLPIVSRNQVGPGFDCLRMHSCGVPHSTVCSCGIVERVEQFKYLGVIIDQKLCWRPHVQYVKKALRKLVYAFTQLCEVLSVDQCRTVYYAYVQSVLQYGILGWGGAASTVLEPIAVSQRSIIKIILKKNYRYPTHQLFKDFPVLNIRQLFIKTLLIFIKNNKSNILNQIDHKYLTRHRSNHGYTTPRLIRCSELVNSFYIAQILYRNLPDEIKQAEGDSVVVYKRKVGRWLCHIGRDASETLILSPYS